jgi:NAD(P)-dependent dehydrogenase (short-subunit alcohol dehydrogenase family)
MIQDENKVVVITGASSGIGRATALKLSRQGHTVVAAARRLQALEELVESCRQLGGKAPMAYALDVANQDEVDRMATTVKEKYGRIDVWVSNASVALFGHFEDIPMEDFRRVMDVNVYGNVHSARAAARIFRQQGFGNMILISSTVGVTGQPFSTPYSISKAAIRNLGFCLEQEFSDMEDVHFCVVRPSSIDTPLFNTAANYMGKVLKAPEPLLPAEAVADKIADLMKNPKPDTHVGALANLSALGKALAPQSFDKKYRDLILQKHFKNEYCAPTKGNLYKPDPNYAAVSGGWLDKDAVKAAKVKKMIAAGLTLVAGAIGWALLGGSNEKKEKTEKVRKKAVEVEVREKPLREEEVRRRSA